VLNHKPTKVLAKDSKVSRKPLPVGRTYHRRRALRKMKTVGKATGNHPGKYMICETVSMHQHHSAVETCHHGPSSRVSRLDMTC